MEDALVGVAAGRAGEFGLVVGVDRVGQAKALAEHGANVVVEDLGELLADVTEKVHRAGPRAHRLRAAARRILAASAEHPEHKLRIVSALQAHGVVVAMTGTG